MADTDELSLNDVAASMDALFILVCMLLLLLMQAGFALYEVSLYCSACVA